VPEPQRACGASGEVDRIRSQDGDDGGLEEVEEVSCHAADDAVLTGEDETILEEGDALNGFVLKARPSVRCDVSCLTIYPVE
jgi:hypothetical protein